MNDHLHKVSYSRVAIGRYVCAGVLITAGGLKLHEVISSPLSDSRWTRMCIIECEFLLALWLLSGMQSKWARRVAIITFTGFACYAISIAVSGATNCGCFGRARVHPWWTSGLDIVMIVLLSLWRPTESNSRTKYWPLAIGLTGTILLVFLTFSAINIESTEDGMASDGKFVLIEPEKWIGRPLPIAEYLGQDWRVRLTSGNWVMIFIHSDCTKCQSQIPKYEDYASTSQTKFVFVEVPPCERHEHTHQSCEYACVSDSRKWIITTPCELHITDGRVISVTTNEAAFLIAHKDRK
jgi:hypothetical protein